MKTLHGTMYFNPLEGGIWAFEDEDGTRYQLDGVGGEVRGEGRKITVTGEVETDAVGIGMIYPVFKVHNYEMESVTERRKRRPPGALPKATGV